MLVYVLGDNPEGFYQLLSKKVLAFNASCAFKILGLLRYESQLP